VLAPVELGRCCPLPGFSVANASQQLREAGLITAERDGKYIRYALCDDAILDLIASVHRVAERRRAEVSKSSSDISERDVMEPISRADLLARAQEGAVMVVDVHPQDEYAPGRDPMP
jgi:hypothetical protein